MNASAWSNGGTQYGIRVGKPNRDRYFDPSWRFIEVEIEGKNHRFELTGGFWRNCPEFRDRGQPIIRDWLSKHKSLYWESGQPPRVTLVPIGNAKFRLLP